MSPVSHRTRLRWLVPVTAALVLVAGGSAVGLVTATAQGSLPDRTAAQLLVDVQQARLSGLSGTLEESAALGLPSIPGAGDAGSADLTSLVSGTHTLQLWYADPQHVRLAVLGSLGESDVVRNGSDLWTWSAHDRTVTHREVPAGSAPDGSAPDGSGPEGSPLTPQQAADRALAAIDPSTQVSTDGTAVVAGRSAYELVLQPRDPGTLVGSVRIAIDGATHVPTRVQVFARGATQPAFEVGFTSFDPTTPAPSVFDFTPPPGATVTQATTPSEDGHGAPAPGSSTPPQQVGSGWTSVVVAEVPTGGSGSGGSQLDQLVSSLPTVQGSWGSGHLLQGTLFSAILTDDGRLAVGAVGPDLVEQALARS